MAGAVRKARIKEVPLSEIKDDLSRFLREAEKQEIVITRHGKPAGVLIGFESEDDWFDYRLEHDPRFVERIARSRAQMRAGQSIPLEQLAAEFADQVAEPAPAAARPRRRSRKSTG